MKNRFYMFLLLIFCCPFAHAAESNTVKLQNLLETFEAEALLNGNSKIETWNTLRVQFLKLLADTNDPADPNVSSSESGTTVLQLAAHMGDYDFINCLLANGADINQSDYGQITPLILACGARQCRIIEFLMHSGANPNLDSFDTGTALNYVKRLGNFEIVYLLLRFGADPNFDGFGISPVESAISSGSRSCVVLLLAFGARIPNLSSLDPRGLSPEMRLFLQSLFRRNVDLFDFLLEFATRTNNRQLRLFILEARRCAFSGGNVLHFAIARRQSADLLQYLELYGSAGSLIGIINQENTFRETPLFLALMFRDEDAIQDLLDYGAIPNFGGPETQSLNFANSEFISQSSQQPGTMVSHNISPRLLRRIFQIHVIHNPEIVERVLLALHFNTPALSQIVAFLISLSYAQIQIPLWGTHGKGA